MSRLTVFSRRLLASKNALPLRGGGGGPLPGGPTGAPTQPLEESNELIWDDGTNNKETCLDSFDLLSSNQARLYLALGLAGFYGIYSLAKWDDKASRKPWVDRTLPEGFA